VIFALLGTGAVMLIAYWFHARRAAAPILDLTLFRIPTFCVSIIGGSLFRVGVGASPFLLPLMFQIGFGLNPFHSGMLTFVSALGAIAMKISAPPILRNLGFRTVLIINAVLSAAFVAAPSLFTPQTPWGFILIVLLIGGFFRSLQFTAVNALGYSDIDNERMSRATSMTSVCQQVALSVGVSIGALTLESAMRLRGGTELVPADFTWAFVLVGTMSFLSFLVFLRLPPEAGAEVSGHRRQGLVVPDPVIEMREKA
jgi:fucose permease